jgi:hypothetical protein
MKPSSAQAVSGTAELVRVFDSLFRLMLHVLSTIGQSRPVEFPLQVG